MYETVMRLWKAGKTSKEIEAILGLPESDVLGYVRKGRWYKQKGKNVVTPSQKVTSEPKVCKRPQKPFTELKVSTQGRKKSFSHEKFVELWNTRITINKMAEILETTPGSVKVYASRHREECPSRNKSRKK